MAYISSILTGAVGVWLCTSPGGFDMMMGVLLFFVALNTLALRVGMGKSRRD
jgi:hypothetical protein